MEQRVTRRTLGRWYILSAGVVLALILLGHAVVTVETDPMAALIAASGLVPAGALVGSAVWLQRSDLNGAQVWSIAQWSGLGIALLTLLNLAVLIGGVPTMSMTPVLLAIGIAMGGINGVLIGALLELKQTATRLEHGNDVLGRVIQHNLRNDLTVVLGHLGELENTVNGEATAHVDALTGKVNDIVMTTEKARQIDVALAADERTMRPVDIIDPLQDRLSAIQRTNPEATIETDLPNSALIKGDWFVKTALDNVLENALVHASGTPTLSVEVAHEGTEIVLQVIDDCPPLPENERVVFSDAEETQLDHSTGVGLWLVHVVMKSYDGSINHEYNEDQGNTVELRFPAATTEEDSTMRRLRAGLSQANPAY
jgi:signal transduction histidine kinase